MYPDCDVVGAFVAYGNDHPDEFVSRFNETKLTKKDLKERRRVILIAVGIVAVIIIGIFICSGIQSVRKDVKNDARTSAVVAQAQAAEAGKLVELGTSSDYYNLADMMVRAKESFPGEDVYYKITTTENYVAVVITTAQKKNVYLNRYVPVEGAVGDADAVYKLEISMVSDAIQPDDILQNYSGILHATSDKK